MPTPASASPSRKRPQPADGSTRFNRTGFTGGGQAGYNWQTGAFVLGVQGDINYTDARRSGTITRATASGLSLGLYGLRKCEIGLAGYCACARRRYQR
jgi:opacity protein-like surface antigen